MGREPGIQMNEALRGDLLMGPAVLAVGGAAVDEGVVGPDVRAARAPLSRVLGKVADEDDNREAAAQLILLGLDPSDPVVQAGSTGVVGTRLV